MGVGLVGIRVRGRGERGVGRDVWLGMGCCGVGYGGVGWWW